MDPKNEYSASLVRDLAAWTYQKRREAAMGLALAVQAERHLAHHHVANDLEKMQRVHEDRMAELHAALWPADADPASICTVPDMLELFQVLVAAIEHCDLFTDAPEKSRTLQWLAPYIERASTWLGHDRITAGLASIPKAD